MAQQTIPEYADIAIVFTGLQYSSGSTTVDLTTVDDIIFSLANGSASSPPFLIFKKSLNPERFSIDDAAKTVSVQIFSADGISTVGKYSMNLWLVVGNQHLTHAAQSFKVVPAVKYST
jgi:hypothetical protein